uniref:Uncharacterized protein n=1 Tax=Oncorhynchus tshawytscha TaxID=74940 RepID=A0A8C8M797_ONCTS
MEIERKRLAATAEDAEVPEDVKQTLLELREIGATMTTALPELRKKAFCQFMALGFPHPELPNVWLWDLPGMGRVGELAPSSTKTDQKALSSSPQPPSPFPPMSLSQVCVQLLQSLSAQGRMCYLVLSKADLMGEGAVEEVRRWSEEALGRLVECLTNTIQMYK